jgi:hypothetical protein
MTADVVNLRLARKQRARAEAEQQAAENRSRFGRTKADRELEKARAELAGRKLEQLRRGEDDRG